MKEPDIEEKEKKKKSLLENIKERMVKIYEIAKETIWLQISNSFLPS